MRPTRRTAVMAAVAVLATAAVAVVALITLVPVRAPAQRLADRQLPALDALNDTTAAISRGQAQVLAAAFATTTDARTAAITAGADASRTKDSAWSRFLADAQPSSAAAELIDQFTSTDQRSATLVAALFTSDPATDPA